MALNKNMIAISGGPGAGKTTLLNLLLNQGFQVVSESGRQIIKERIAKKLPPRPSPSTFALEMFNADLKNYMDFKEAADLVFFDRSFLDSAALLYEADRKTFEKIQTIIDHHRFNEHVFFAPPWQEIYRNDEERDQDFAEAEKIYDMLASWYEKNGYRVIELPKATVENRLAFILGNLK
jgi:predicted ATPase